MFPIFIIVMFDAFTWKNYFTLKLPFCVDYTQKKATEIQKLRHFSESIFGRRLHRKTPRENSSLMEITVDSF